jgi:uncharacterized protein YndB with AHSA1/START domain
MPSRHPIGDPTETPADAAGIVRASIDIAAAPADVFHALADPRELAAWLGSDPARASTESTDAPSARPRELLPASRWHAQVVAPDGMPGVVTGEYGTVAPPHVLETTWRASWNDFATEGVRFELAPIEVGGAAGTRVTVTHTRAAARLLAPSSAFVAGHTLAGELWPSLLARLAVYVATRGALARWGGHDASAESFEALHRAVVELHHAH